VRRIKLLPEMRTTLVTVHCSCGYTVRTRSTNEAIEAWADHQALVHGGSIPCAPASALAAASRSE
jgi:hypothetical protein